MKQQPRAARWIDRHLAWPLIGVCLGPVPGCGDDGVPSAEAGSTGSDHDTTGEADSTGSGGAASSSGEGSESSGEPPGDACEALAPTDCVDQAGCGLIQRYPQDPVDACTIDASASELACASVGAPIEEDRRTTFYTMIDGEPWFLLAGQPCIEPVTDQPLTWTECTGAEGEPQPCQCLCGANGCPAENDWQTMQACGLDTPCGEGVLHEVGLGLYPETQCVLEALRDRVAGTYGVRFVSVTIAETHVFSTGGDQVRMIRQQSSDFCTGPLAGSWDSVMECTLQPPAYFDACIAGSQSEVDDCLFGNEWFTDCQPVEAACP